MDDLNYHHLHYFWMVAREGTIAQACALLNLSQPTISTQLKKLEQSVGAPLFRKAGRKLELTELGKQVYRYADEIFAKGRDLQAALRGVVNRQAQRLAVGIVDSVPRALVARLLKPLLHLPTPVQFACEAGTLQPLVGALAAERLDVLLSDVPLGPPSPILARNRLLGGCGIAFVGEAALAERYRRQFPRSLQEAPLLVPSFRQPLRCDLVAWWDSQQLRPQVLGEIDDPALLIELATTGVGLIPVPRLLVNELGRLHGLRLAGQTEEVRMQVFAISIQRESPEPLLDALAAAAENAWEATH